MGPGEARDDTGVCSPDSHFKQHDIRPRSRGVNCPSSVYFSPSLRGRGRRESRMRAAPAVSCANCAKETPTSIQVKRRQSGFPCAMGYGLLRALLGDRLSCHRHLQGCPCELSASTGAPGPHDFAVRDHLRQSLRWTSCDPGKVRPRRVAASFVRAPADRSRADPPCDSICAPDAVASTASHRAFVTCATPLVRVRRRES